MEEGPRKGGLMQNHAKILLSALFMSALSGAPALATTYQQLISDGYKTGPMIQSAAGKWGWVVSKGGTRYFCNFRGGTVRNGKAKIVVFSASGRQLTGDLSAYVARGGKVDQLAELADLRAGRVEPQSVSNCLAK
jgi:hypothetical protein